MVVSVAMPESRNAWSACGMVSPAKAKRSRSSTGAERWLKPMTTTEIKAAGWRLKVERNPTAKSAHRRLAPDAKHHSSLAKANSLVVQTGIEVGDPEREQQGREGDDDANGESPGRASEKGPGREQLQINEPEQCGPDDLGIRKIRQAFLARQLLAGGEAARSEEDAQEREAARDEVQP